MTLKATPPTQFAPVRAPIVYIAGLILEFAWVIWLTRTGVAKGWWSDPKGWLLVVAIPLGVRFLIVCYSYRLSRTKGMAIPPNMKLSPGKWCKFFLTEYFHFCKQALVFLPFPWFFRTTEWCGERGAGDKIVLLQHGYLHNGAVWRPMAKVLTGAGYRVFTISQPLHESIDLMADRLAARIESVCEQTGAAQLTLVAHSMGGLISRAYLRKYGDARIRKLVTLGSPHHGTFHASLGLGENGKQMQPGNAWLAALGQEPVFRNFTSIYSVYDTIISPQDSSHLEGVENVVVTGVGHVSMFASKTIQAEVLKAIA